MKRYPRYILIVLLVFVAMESTYCNWFRRDANKDNTQMGKAQEEADLKNQDSKDRQKARRSPRQRAEREGGEQENASKRSEDHN